MQKTNYKSWTRLTLGPIIRSWICDKGGCWSNLPWGACCTPPAPSLGTPALHSSASTGHPCYHGNKITSKFNTNSYFQIVLYSWGQSFNQTTISMKTNKKCKCLLSVRVKWPLKSYPLFMANYFKWEQQQQKNIRETDGIRWTEWDKHYTNYEYRVVKRWNYWSQVTWKKWILMMSLWCGVRQLSPLFNTQNDFYMIFHN